MVKNQYTLEFKIEMLVKFYSNKISIQNFCIEQNIPRTTFIYWKTQFKAKNLINPKKSSGRKTKITERLINFIETKIKEEPFQKINHLHRRRKMHRKWI